MAFPTFNSLHLALSAAHGPGSDAKKRDVLVMGEEKRYSKAWDTGVDSWQ